MTTTNTENKETSTLNEMDVSRETSQNNPTESIPQLTPEQLELLKKPLSSEAVSQHPTKPYLSTIKAIYVIERFNDVFGVGKWFLRDWIVESDSKMIVGKVWFSVPEYSIEVWAYGGNDNVDRGDAYKGMVTDAITKIGSYLGVGMDVFKGLTERADSPKKGATRANLASGGVSKTIRTEATKFKMLLEKAITKEELDGVAGQIHQAEETGDISAYEVGILRSVFTKSQARIKELNGQPFN